MNIRALALDNISKAHKDNIKAHDALLSQALQYDDVAKLYTQCRTLQLDIAKAEYEGTKCDKLLKELDKCKISLHSALNKHGIDSKELKVKYNCPKCHDTGILKGQDCTCLKNEINKLLLASSGINKDTLPTFDKLDYSVYDSADDMRKIAKLLHDFVCEDNFKKVVTLTGQVGVGKTYLMECMIRLALDNEYYTVYTTASGLNNDMLKYHTSPVAEKMQYLSKYYDCDYLFVDDLGTENNLRNVTTEYLYQILAERLRTNKKTVFTTNLSLQQIIDLYDERIFSRIADKNNCLAFNVQGKDLRTGIKK